MRGLSIAILVERGGQSLAAALDAFCGQTVAATAFEVIVVAPGGRSPVRRLPRHRRLAIRAVRRPRRGGRAAAIAAAAAAARSPIVAVISDRWRPMPAFVDYAIEFHARQPGAADVLVPAIAIDPAMAAHPLLWWLAEHKLYGIDALPSGIHNWRALRFDALCVKRDLVSDRPIPAGEDDDQLMAAEWALRAPVRAFAEPVPVLQPSAAPVLEDVLAAEYGAAYARRRATAASPQPFAGVPLDARFADPARFLLAAADRAELVAAAGDLERDLGGANPRFAVGDEAERFAVLGKLYLAALSHARSEGWSDAAAGRRRVRADVYASRWRAKALKRKRAF